MLIGGGGACYQFKGGKYLMDVETKLGELIVSEKTKGENFEREREREREKWRRIELNY